MHNIVTMDERIAFLDFLASKHTSYQLTVRWRLHRFWFAADKIEDAKQVLPGLTFTEDGPELYQTAFQVHVEGLKWRQNLVDHPIRSTRS